MNKDLYTKIYDHFIICGFLSRPISSVLFSISGLAPRPPPELFPWTSLGDVTYVPHTYLSWLRGSVVERRSLAGELSLSCARPAADG